MIAWRLTTALALSGAFAGACGPDFDPPSLINGVRILAVAADHPYAAPGEQVTLQVLAVDGRADAPEPMAVAWLPAICENPPDDLYYRCYPPAVSQLSPGVDLTGSLVAGATLSFTVPGDAIQAHAVQPGRDTPYGVVFAFAIACAGHVEYVPADPASESPATLPFGCFDAAHHALGAQEFTFAFMRVYVFESLRNANPTIDHLVYGGAPVDPAQGVNLAHCARPNVDDCAQTDLDLVVPPSSQEDDPTRVTAGGGAEKEAIWVDYFLTAGKLETDSVLLFDVDAGPVTATATGYAAPTAAGEQTLWSVVHDNRGGASWLAVPLHVN